MPTFGIIAKGVSDQSVIRNILSGYFGKDQTFVNPVQPLPMAGSPAKWTRVLHCLTQREPEEALQFNDFLVIHIDTDIQEEKGFDVPRRESGNELSIAERVDRVINRLMRDMDAELLFTDRQRLLFAISVDSIECWLLPLFANDKQAAKTTGCQKAADAALRKKGMDGLSDGETKFPLAYQWASHEYTKRNVLLEKGRKNPSLEIFLTRLQQLQVSMAPAVDGSTPDAAIGNPPS